MKRNRNLLSEIGVELRRIRDGQGKSLKNYADVSDITPMYLSEIERNKKTPSDELVEKLAPLYKVDAMDMYEGFGKIPQKMEDEILGNSVLYEILYKLSEDNNEGNKDQFYLTMRKEYDKIFN